MITFFPWCNLSTSLMFAGPFNWITWPINHLRCLCRLSHGFTHIILPFFFFLKLHWLKQIYITLLRCKFSHFCWELKKKQTKKSKHVLPRLFLCPVCFWCFVSSTTRSEFPQKHRKSLYATKIDPNQMSFRLEPQMKGSTCGHTRLVFLFYVLWTCLYSKKP